jgi:hypothetical protein
LIEYRRNNVLFSAILPSLIHARGRQAIINTHVRYGSKAVKANNKDQ